MSTSTSFVHPAALFPPTAKELEARRHPASLVTSEGDEPENLVPGEDDDAMDGEDTDRVTREDDEPGKNDISPAGTDASAYQAAT